MQYKPTLANRDVRLLRVLLLPSWLSGLTSVVFGLVVVAGSAFIASLSDSKLNNQLVDFYTEQLSSSQVSGSTSDILSGLSVMLFWALVGVAVSMFLSSVVQIFTGTIRSVKELNYIHVDRGSLLKSALAHLVSRLLVAGVWFGFILFSLNRLLPYGVAASHSASQNLVSVSGILYLLLSFIIVAACMHIHTIFFRLLLLRPRVFSPVYLTQYKVDTDKRQHYN